MPKKPKNELSTADQFKIVKAAIVGDPDIGPDDGLKALSWIARYLAKCERELVALDLALLAMAEKIRKG